MKRHHCSIVRQQALTWDIYRLTVACEGIADSAIPGQFVHIRIIEGIDPLLRRPFSIHDVDRKQGTFDVLYRVVGRGTGLLSQTVSGSIDLMGPLGNGFELSAKGQVPVVAGGMGAAPIFFLLHEFIEKDSHPVLFWGVKHSREFFGLDELRNRGVELHLASEDGLVGDKGLITHNLSAWLAGHPEAFDQPGYLCGPKPLLAAVNGLLKSSLSWQVSVEENMACGVGVCAGCAVKIRSGGYRMACSDGPVFRLGEVDWND
jgi:dihydroorotate dehydrogenase electron transfer subunit